MTREARFGDLFFGDRHLQVFQKAPSKAATASHMAG
jgi:hypothetical protein